MAGTRSGVAKKVIRTAILVMLAADAAVLATLIWLLARSECPLSESLAVITTIVRGRQEGLPKVSLQKTEAGLDLWNTPQGGVWDIHGDAVLPFLLAEQQRDIYEPAGHVVRRGDIVLDCGANIGVFTSERRYRVEQTWW